MGEDRHVWWIASLGAGACAGLALPPLGWPWLLWPCLAVLWAVASSAPAPALPALLWGLALVLVSHRWLLWLHPLDWVGVPAPLSLPICVLVWLACGLAGGLAVLLWVKLVRRLDPLRPASALQAALLWGLAEVLLSQGPLFWLGLGASALPADRALAGLGALGGAGLIATVQLGIGWLLWRALGSRVQSRRWWLLLVLVLVAVHGLGQLSLAAIPAAGGSQERLVVLQPSIPTRHKFEAGSQRALLGQLLDGQRRAAQMVPPVGSLLLPEGALPLGQALPEPPEVEVLSGGFRQPKEGVRSSLLRFSPSQREPVAWIDKHRLVPLGEWVPLARFLSWSGFSALGGLEPGAASRLLPRPAGAIGVAICYELADGHALAVASHQGARWLLASANLDPYPRLLQGQFMALARLRAIETGRWLVSAANTGPSLLVDARGRLVSLLPSGRPAQGLMVLEQRTGLTPYVRWKEWPLLMLLLWLVWHRHVQSQEGEG